ncbi:unnamed protein product, partial [Discosporangium mesarthrocarpum]
MGAGGGMVPWTPHTLSPSSSSSFDNPPPPPKMFIGVPSSSSSRATHHQGPGSLMGGTSTLMGSLGSSLSGDGLGNSMTMSIDPVEDSLNLSGVFPETPTGVRGHTRRCSSKFDFPSDASRLGG